MSDVLIVVGVFLVIVAAIWLKRPLWQSIALGTIALGIFYRIPILTFLQVSGKASIKWTTINILLVIYLYTFLQKLMSQRQMLQKAERLLTGLLNNRRLSVAISPVIIGLLPTPGAVLMAGAMVETSCNEYMSKEDISFVTSFYRHVPESALPTYSSVLLALSVTGVPAWQFLLGMLPFLFMLMLTPYLVYLRKIPKETGIAPSSQRMKDMGKLLYYLWPVVATLIMILAFKMDVLLAAAITTIVFVLISKFPIKDILATLKSAVEPPMLLSMWLIMVFKDVFTATGIVERLPGTMSTLPIPMFITFAIIFFFGSVISGQSSMIPLILPIAMVGVSNPLPLLILLMSLGHSAMQLSPTHICLPICCDYFGVKLSSLIKRTLPVVALLIVFSFVYYFLLNFVF